MRAPHLMVLALLAATGCKDQTAPSGPKSMAEAGAESAGLPRPLPGLYRSTVELVSMEAPGLPPQMAEQMKRSVAARSSGAEFCLTPAEADKGYEERVKKLAGRPECSFDRYNAAAGTLDAQLTCTGEQGMKSVMTMKGTMTPQGSDVTMAMDQSGSQLPGGGMKMTMHVKSERVGECPAPAATPAG